MYAAVAVEVADDLSFDRIALVRIFLRDLSVRQLLAEILSHGLNVPPEAIELEVQVATEGYVLFLKIFNDSSMLLLDLHAQPRQQALLEGRFSYLLGQVLSHEFVEGLSCCKWFFIALALLIML